MKANTVRVDLDKESFVPLDSNKIIDVDLKDGRIMEIKLSEDEHAQEGLEGMTEVHINVQVIIEGETVESDEDVLIQREFNYAVNLGHGIGILSFGQLVGGRILCILPVISAEA